MDSTTRPKEHPIFVQEQGLGKREAHLLFQAKQPEPPITAFQLNLEVITEEEQVNMSVLFSFDAYEGSCVYSSKYNDMMSVICGGGHTYRVFQKVIAMYKSSGIRKIVILVTEI